MNLHLIVLTSNLTPPFVDRAHFKRYAFVLVVDGVIF